jgi:Mor family transcriptional regulator
MSNRNLANIETLKQVIGTNLFEKVVDSLGGKNLYIPPDAEFHDKQQRNKRIREDYHSGMEVHDLMVKYKLSKSRIHKIIEIR